VLESFKERKKLKFDRMTFYSEHGKIERSHLCPSFPKRVDAGQSVVLDKEMQIQAQAAQLQAQEMLIEATYDQLVKSLEDRKRLEKENPNLVATRDKMVQRKRKKPSK
jgi:hypothetical protein